MAHKNKFKFLYFFILLFLLSANFACALEANYPPLLGHKITDTSGLGDYAIYLFTFGISVAGVVALISFAVGAVMFMASGDDPTLHGDSIDRMKGAIFGLVLIICSFLIINTINPQLETPSITPLPAVSLAPVAIPPGVYLYTQASCEGNSSIMFTGSTDNIGDDAGKIQSVNIINDPASGTYYGVIFHKSEGYKNGGECNIPITSSGAGGCFPVKNPANTKSADIFTLDPFGTANAGGYVTFYSKPWGELTGSNAGFKEILDKQITPVPYKVSADSVCFDYTGVKEEYEYEHKCNPSKNCEEQNTRPCTSDLQCSAGGEICVAGKCVANPALSQCSDKACESFEDCPGSIQIDGHYIVGLYSEDCWNECATGSAGNCYQNCIDGKGPGTIIDCQTFTSDDDADHNLNAQPIIGAGDGALNSIYIIPTQ